MAQVPWLPSTLPADATAERCSECGRRGMVPWTLRRALDRRVYRRWICTHCQASREREEPE
jgi:hypothetical protein